MKPRSGAQDGGAAAGGQQGPQTPHLRDLPFKGGENQGQKWERSVIQQTHRTLASPGAGHYCTERCPVPAPPGARRHRENGFGVVQARPGGGQAARPSGGGQGQDGRHRPNGRAFSQGSSTPSIVQSCSRASPALSPHPSSVRSALGLLSSHSWKLSLRRSPRLQHASSLAPSWCLHHPHPRKKGLQRPWAHPEVLPVLLRHPLCGGQSLASLCFSFLVWKTALRACLTL